MKTIFSIIIAAVLLTVPSVKAQQFNLETITIGTASGNLTNNVPAFGTNTAMGVVIDCQKYKKVALALTTKLAAAGTTAIDYVYTKSADGSNYTTANTGSFTVTPTGTISVNTIVNVDAAGLKSIKITSINNPNNAILTNTTFTAGYKQAEN